MSNYHPAYMSAEPIQPHHFPHHNYPIPPSKTPFSLLSELQHLKDDEIEVYLPQICNILVEEGGCFDPGVYAYFQHIIVTKCEDSLGFGLRMCNALKTQKREANIRNILQRVEEATRWGSPHPNPHTNAADLPYRRNAYYEDMQAFFDFLSQIGEELKKVPHAQRGSRLSRGLEGVNSFLNERMVAKAAYPLAPRVSFGSEADTAYSDQAASQEAWQGRGLGNMDILPAQPSSPPNPHQSLHYPLQASSQAPLRMVGVLVGEGEVLQSKDKAPYLVYVEVVGGEGGHVGGMELFAPEYASPLVSPHPSAETHSLHLPSSSVGSSLGSTSASSSNSESAAGTETGVSELRESGVLVEGGEKDKRPQPGRLAEGSEDCKELENVRVFARSSLSKGGLKGGSSQGFDEHQHRHSGRDASIPSGYPYPAHDAHATEEFQYSSPYPQTSYSHPYAHHADHSYPPQPELRHHVHPTYAHQYPQHPQHQHEHQHQYFATSSSFHPPYDSRASHHTLAASSYPHHHPAYPTPHPANDHPAPTALCLLSPREQERFAKMRLWRERKRIFQARSPFGNMKGYDIKPFIVKTGDDLTKEQLASQLLFLFQRIFQTEKLKIWVKPYQILPTSTQGGLVEYVEGTMSLDKIKKIYLNRSFSLTDYFYMLFGDSMSLQYQKAVRCFVYSLVGYSLFTYVLQVKDRHNANILIDSDGHIVHIDFGFILGDSPGFNLNFETAPFKFTPDYLEVMGGFQSVHYSMFEDLFLKGFDALRKHVDEICALIELFYGDKRKNAADGVRDRLLGPRFPDDVLNLVMESYNNWRTRQYDLFQHRNNNIQP
eukprot:gene24377-29471_t